LETDVLPVGVTPITAVPTRITFGESPEVEVSLANQNPEHFDVSRLPEFATEQLNAGNVKRVTKIVVRLPSPRLREGILFVDTPGLGSLATRGAAETLAYLPRCDLGVVLIDAGSALTQDDLHTIHLLYEAAIPATVLLSKADLLKPGDRSRVMDYVRDHIRTDLNLDLPVHAVSIMPEGKDLLAQWFAQEIAPLYLQSQELKARSVRRKAEALKRSVALALRSRLCRKDEISQEKLGQFRDIEAKLRQANGRIEGLRDAAGHLADDIGRLASIGLEKAAASLLQLWSYGSPRERTEQQTALDAVAQAVEERAQGLWNAMISLSHSLTASLGEAAQDLNTADVPSEDEFPNLVREMPVVDLGRVNFSIKKPRLALHLGPKVGKFLLTRRLNRLAGDALLNALATYSELLYDWSEKTVGTIQRRFDAYANSYRAQVERAIDAQALPVEQEERMRRDLAALEGIPDEVETPRELC
jgi:GTP-binding protein EngB required for normal cell division